MKRKALTLLVMHLIALIVFAQEVRPTKNVILMIPDGTSISVLTAARWLQHYRGEEARLQVDPYLSGTVTTFSLNEPIGDSAPTTSTYMTGVPMRAGNVSIYSEVDPVNDLVKLNPDSTYQPMMTILEAMRIEQNKAVGLVVTVEFPHATPADCSAHSLYRGDYQTIAPQMAYNNLSVMFGGGNNFITDDIRDHFRRTGTTLVQNDRQAMLDYQGDKLWALYKPVAMSQDLNRNPEEEPSLAEMTKKALEILSKNENGFFLMVEGSQVDYAAHANDPVGIISEFLAFDKAVGEVMEFAKRDGNTTVVVVPDHGNSGFSIGRSGAKKRGQKFLTLSDMFGVISDVKRTAVGMQDILVKTQAEDFEKVFKEYTNIDLTKKEVELLKGATNYKLGDYTKAKDSKAMSNYISEIYSSRMPFGFTSGGHTGEEVFLATYHPQGDILTGNVWNTELHNYLYNVSGLKVGMKEHTARAFAKHTKVFDGMKCEVVKEKDQLSKLIVKDRKNTLIVNASSSIAYYNGVPVDLNSVAVYVKENDTFYLPRNLKEITFGKKR